MTTTLATHRWLFVRHNPLVPVAALFLAGITLGIYTTIPAILTLTAAITFLTTYALAETIAPPTIRSSCTHLALALAIVFAGTTVWRLNQSQSEETHLARFVPTDDELPITLHARVVVPPARDAGHHGNTYFTLEATALLTNQGWVESHGFAQAKWRANLTAPQLHRGDEIEAYGWLSRPPPALNPGAMDPRRRLAADRIFAQVRVPRSLGIEILRPAAVTSTASLAALRLFLRGKLLEHTATLDSDAANTMVALLLGQRDASIDDVSRAFADAGVAHLLAISGAHIVFLAGFVWFLLRFVPMRPQWRDLLCAAIVAGYVVATPCGPPVIRAAIVLVLVLVSRFMRRPPKYMNMLAAAIICIVLIRPADLMDAGFQLTFCCTAALLLLAERVPYPFFSRHMRRAELIADLANTRRARFQLEVRRVVYAILIANLLGTLIAAPLVLFHFQQFTPYGVLTGLLAFPLVALTMITSLVQLLFALVSAHLAGLFAPISTVTAHVMIVIIRHFAGLPGAAIPIRSPPAAIVAVLYVPILLWLARSWLGLRRAVVINVGLAAFVAVGGYYAFTSEIGTLQLQALSVGQGSALIVTTPSGGTLVVNAGSRDLPDIVPSAISPTLRANGVRSFGTMIVTSLDTVHAKNAAEVVVRYRPATLLVSPDDGTTTFARMAVEEALTKSPTRTDHLAAGDILALGPAALHVLWPADGKAPDPALVMMLEYAGRRVLLTEPTNLPALALLASSHVDLHADAVLLFGPDRGHSDGPLLQLLHDTTNAGTIVYSGRTPWSSSAPSANCLNTAGGALTLMISRQGVLSLSR